MVTFTDKGILACSFSYEDADGKSKRLMGLLLENESAFDDVREIIENGPNLQAKGSPRKKNRAKIKSDKRQQDEKTSAVVEIIDSDDDDLGGGLAVKPVELNDFKASFFVVDQPLFALEKSGVWERNPLAEELFEHHEEKVGVNRGPEDRRSKEADKAEAATSKEPEPDEQDRVIILESDSEHHDDGDRNPKAGLDSDSEGHGDDAEVAGKKTMQLEKDNPASDTESDDDDSFSGSRPKAEGAKTGQECFGANVLTSAPAMAREDPNRLAPWTGGVRVLDASAS
jgi:hypothetical protein